MIRREQRRDIVIDLLITIGLLLLGGMAVRTYVRFIWHRIILLVLGGGVPELGLAGLPLSIAPAVPEAPGHHSGQA